MGMENLNWIKSNNLRVVSLIDPYIPTNELRGLRTRLGMQASKVADPGKNFGRTIYRCEEISKLIESWSRTGWTNAAIATMLNSKCLPTQTNGPWNLRLVRNYKMRNGL